MWFELEDSTFADASGLAAIVTLDAALPPDGPEA